MLHFRTHALIACLGLSTATVSSATVVGINFETFPNGTPIPDGTVITDQFASRGIRFIDGPSIVRPGTVFTSGVSLNEFEFPPTSGVNLLAEEAGVLRAEFIGGLASTVEGWFTYSPQIRISLYNDQGQYIGGVDSTHDANFVSSGNPPNEYIGLTTFTPRIAAFEISFVPQPGGAIPPDAVFTLDDLRYEIHSVVPEASFGWAGFAVLAGGYFIHRRSQRR